MEGQDSKSGICVIIGASHAGVNCAFALRREGWAGPILIFDRDPEMPYHRPPLSKTYLTDANGQGQNLLKPLESYTHENIDLKLGIWVNEIDPEGKSIVLEDGQVQPYTKLVLATGARPLIPPIPGIDMAKNLFLLRTAKDVAAIKKAIKENGNGEVLVIGGGYIGLEIAASLKKMNLKVTLLEREERVLARVTAPEMSTFFEELHEKNGVSLFTGKDVVEIKTDETRNQVLCADGSSFNADIIIVGVGIRVNTELAEKIGLDIQNGIQVNETARTSNADIYAIGDCTLHHNPHYNRYVRLESVQNAVDQAKIAAASICGKEVVYNAIPWFWSDQYQIKLQMTGLSQGYDEAIQRIEKDKENCFSVWYFKGDELLAVDAINNAKAYVLGMRFIQARQKLDKSKVGDSSIPIKPTSFLA
ncbi:MAG: FAD/NAD(P)-binding oxidoreductase [Bacteroidota bacterium]